MLLIISEIDEFKGGWKLLKNLQHKINILKKISTIESIGSSNRIEGNKLSDREVEKLLTNINIKLFKNREEEVVGYAELIGRIFNDSDLIPLSENYIKYLHKELLKYIDKNERHRGEYKKISNTLMVYDNNDKELDIVFQTSAPFETPLQMEELIQRANNNLSNK